METGFHGVRDPVSLLNIWALLHERRLHPHSCRALPTPRACHPPLPTRLPPLRRLMYTRRLYRRHAYAYPVVLFRASVANRVEQKCAVSAQASPVTVSAFVLTCVGLPRSPYFVRSRHEKRVLFVWTTLRVRVAKLR